MQMGGGSLMAIGQGRGEGKAKQALEQALHHPLLESTPLDSAAGIIANFTGGSDLTFIEVMDALNYLQEQTGGKAEIIPGVINDSNMQGRTEVILIVTGLGATPLDEAIPGSGRFLPFQKEDKYAGLYGEPEPAHFSNHSQPETPPVEVSSAPINLDIPAFMRRRNRYTASVNAERS